MKIRTDEKGYTPSMVTIAKGQSATIEFTRTSDKTCARDVVFPELNIKKEMPKGASCSERRGDRFP